MKTPTTQYSLKGKSTIYTDEKRKAIQYNARHDECAREKTAELCKKADYYLEHLDAIYDMIVAEGLFRFYYVGSVKDPDRAKCRYCGTNIHAKFGWYSWKHDPINEPWKIICPECGRKFPSNDFGSYYKLGLDQMGVFHPEKAKEEHIKLFGGLENVGYLKNELYPEMDEHTDEAGNLVNAGVHGWGVDDGFGYRPPNTQDEWHTYIAYYLHWGIWYEQGIIDRSLALFKDAYLYTDDVKYARAGAILLDRVADFYPDFFWGPWADLRKNIDRGKIVDLVWECFLSKRFAKYYDAFYPAYDDESLIAYLSKKAADHGHENPKSSADLLRKHVEDNILRVIYRDAVAGHICGNFGMDQSSVVTAAVVLNTLPETKEWIDWVMAYGSRPWNSDVNVVRTGGSVMPTLVDIIDRDGMGDESAPGYNIHWIHSLLSAADILRGYELYPEVDLYQNPKFMKMIYAHLKLLMGGYYTAQIADSASFASPEFGSNCTFDVFLSGYMNTGDPVFAQALYLMNGRTAKGLRYPDTYQNPASLESDVEAAIQTYGELNLGSTMQSGYGLMALRDGERTKTQNTHRDFWMYCGSTIGHGHADSLNLGIDAYGLNLAPELGYPRETGVDPHRVQWVAATISHNTVVVDGMTQNRLQHRGYPKHFDDGGKVKVMDADKSAVYDQTSAYRRSVVMVEVDDTVSYGVDFFHIKGGRDHMYSFHAQSRQIAEIVGLHPVAQNGGTYAGADVPLDADPSPLSGKEWASNRFTYPDGYTWLDHVERDAHPEQNFTVDFAIEDFRQVLDNASDLHLRMTMLGNKALAEVSIVDGYTVPVSPNPQTNLKYVLVRNQGEEGLETLFTTVFEPYKEVRYLSGMETVSVARADGKTIGEDEMVKAIKVCHTSGRVDYIVYALDNTAEYIVADMFRFRGFVGVAMYEGKKIIHAYVNDGDLLADVISLPCAAYTGTVASFTEAFCSENRIVVSMEPTDVDLSDLSGRHIYVDNDGEQNAVYEIKSATRLDDGTVALAIGDITLIRAYLDKKDTSCGYQYNIERGQTFRIPRSMTFDM